MVERLGPGAREGESAGANTLEGDGAGEETGGEEILADLAVFGVLRPIHHLKSGRDIIEHALIGKWFSEMDLAVGQSSRVSEHS